MKQIKFILSAFLLSVASSVLAQTPKNVEYVLRGYENIVEKLIGVGADLELKEI